MGEDQDASSTPEDDVLREQSFKRATSINLDSFMVGPASSKPTSEASEPSSSKPVSLSTDMETSTRSADAAVGDVQEFFTMDGQATPTQDPTEHLAVHVEQQLGKGLAVAMVLVWTAIGALVGTVLPPLLGAAGLLLMAGVGLVLGERWIQRDAMHLLGLTWVIISMKLLYGLAVDMWRWGWLDGVGPGAGQSLGVLLVALVGLNVALAFRHDEDAIAAQSALVLFAVGSSAGAVYGEVGISAFIVMAMVLMHGLALVRSSGNLASLGISMSYLWVGVHALTNDWTVASMVLVRIDDGLVLFLLLAVVTAANAAMAARFVHHENWLSQAVDAVGLGKPGLWAVSVSLGMVGALMTIAAHRQETGYALAQLMLLTLAFVASYLVVRGVSWSSLMPLVLTPLPFMILLVALFNTGTVEATLPFSLTEYSLFATLAAGLCVTILLMHQADVSDHVLWMGSLTVVTLLTLLIPAEEGGANSRLLLVSQGTVWLGLGALAVMRSSPSMAGVAVLAPYAWLLAFATDLEARLINADLLPLTLAPQDVGWWMGVLVLGQVGVCARLGEATLNLGSGWAGRSEITGRLRDSNLLNLWTLGFALATVTYLAMAHPDGLSMNGLLIGMGLLLLTHAAMVGLGRHHGRPQTLVIVWSLGAVVAGWRYGQEAVWAGVLTLGMFVLVWASVQRLNRGVEATNEQAVQALPGRLVTLHLGVLTAFMLTVALAPLRPEALSGANVLTPSINLWTLTAVGAVSLVMYLQRLSVYDAMLLPSLAALGVLSSMALAGQSEGMMGVTSAAVVMFVAVGAYLAFQGDVRAGLKAVADKEERLARLAQKRGRVVELVADRDENGAQSTTLKALDAELLMLAEGQRRRSKRSAPTDQEDVLVGDIHYRPVVLLTFLAVAFLSSAWLAYATPYGLMALGFSAFFAVVMVGLSRLRANSIGLRLPDVMGVEMPIAVAVVGLVLVHVAGRMTTGVLGDDAVHQAVLMGALTLLLSMGLAGRNDLGLRIPSALEALVGALLVDRLLCLMVGGEVPLPFTTDPFSGTLSWTAPLVFMEAALLGMVLVYDWVEGERLNRQLDDHRTAGGRSAWMMGVTFLSLGVAGALALVAGLRRGRTWQQPAVALTAVMLAPFVVQSLTPWALLTVTPPLSPAVNAAFMGGVALLWTVVAVRQGHALWLASALWACHLLLYPAALLTASLVWLCLSGLLLSCTAWVSGILTRRKSWRVIGALDLIVAWMLAAVALVSGLGSTPVLWLLVATAALLFAVTTLTQTNEKALMDD
jgi:hypothetical protein